MTNEASDKERTVTTIFFNNAYAIRHIKKHTEACALTARLATALSEEMPTAPSDHLPETLRTFLMFRFSEIDTKGEYTSSTAHWIKKMLGNGNEESKKIRNKSIEIIYKWIIEKHEDTLQELIDISTKFGVCATDAAFIPHIECPIFELSPLVLKDITAESFARKAPKHPEQSGIIALFSPQETKRWIETELEELHNQFTVRAPQYAPLSIFLKIRSPDFDLKTCIATIERFIVSALIEHKEDTNELITAEEFTSYRNTTLFDNKNNSRIDSFKRRVLGLQLWDLIDTTPNLPLQSAFSTLQGENIPFGSSKNCKKNGNTSCTEDCEYLDHCLRTANDDYKLATKCIEKGAILPSSILKPSKNCL